MKKMGEEWLDGLRLAYPSASSPYWRALPLRRLRKLLMGTFFIASTVGFSADMLLLGHRSLGDGLFWPIFLGAMAAGLLAARIKRFRLAVALQLILLGVAWLAYRAAIMGATLPIPDMLHRRVVFDAIGIWFGAGFGLRLLFSFVTSEGRDAIRMQTELALAHGIQATLVPTVSFESASFEIYGKSIPSAEMGGDLIDIAQSEGNLLAYVADISGHGLPAGQLMGMLKTAMRLSLQFKQRPVALLESADRVLPAVKEPDMYATLALLCFDGSTEVEYALAGHVPILHYRNRVGDTVRLSMEQLPLGLIPGGNYESRRVSYASGDLFLLVTDGISEVPNDQDEEFGLDRLGQLLTQGVTQPLPQIWESIMGKVKRHGKQRDDQSMLLVRVRR
jgi:sigma-B regulation protein RsbU (phosphoserine phosphatase)